MVRSVVGYVKHYIRARKVFTSSIEADVVTLFYGPLQLGTASFFLLSVVVDSIKLDLISNYACLLFRAGPSVYKWFSNSYNKL